MNKKIGVIGYGNMTSAIIKGVLRAGLVDAENIIVSNRTPDSLTVAKEELGLRITEDNKVVARESDIIMIGVKPHIVEEICNEIRDEVQSNQVVVSVAGGVTLDALGEFFIKDVKTVRTMPNTPALVGEGITALCGNGLVTDNEMEDVKAIFDACGLSEIVEEKYIDVISAVSGSSPAFGYMFIEALADGAVLMGLKRKSAYKFAAQAILGACKMIVETEEHPGVLKDNVCSPGGSTIEGVKVLEKMGFRSAVIEAIEATTEKSRKLL